MRKHLNIEGASVLGGWFIRFRIFLGRFFGEAPIGEESVLPKSYKQLSTAHHLTLSPQLCEKPLICRLGRWKVEVDREVQVNVQETASDVVDGAPRPIANVAKRAGRVERNAKNSPRMYDRQICCVMSC